MLVLSLRPGRDEIKIEGGRIVVKLLEVKRNRVTLGFKAERDIPIERVDLLKENQTCTTTAPSS